MSHVLGSDDFPEELTLSGDRSTYAYANQMALDNYARALEAPPRVTPAVPLARIMDICQKRSQVFVQVSRYLDAVTESEKMLDLARAEGDRAREGWTDSSQHGPAAYKPVWGA